MGPFVKYEDNPILKYKEGEYSGPGHNNIFIGKDGQLYTAFHIHTDYDKRGGISKVYFDENDRMRIEA